jgi:hypothetical protein
LIDGRDLNIVFLYYYSIKSNFLFFRLFDFKWTAIYFLLHDCTWFTIACNSFSYIDDMNSSGINNLLDLMSARYLKWAFKPNESWTTLNYQTWIFLFPPLRFFSNPVSSFCLCIKISKRLFQKISSSNLKKKKAHSEIFSKAIFFGKRILKYLFKGKNGKFGV